MWHREEAGWAELAARLGLSLFALNHTTFEPEARCGCRAGFACTAIGKHPKYKHYLDSGTKGEREARLLVIADWRNGFGVLTGTASGVVVIEVDPRNRGEASLAAVVARRGALPTTLTVLSGRGDGGFHLYYRLPAGRLAVNDSAGKVLGAGIDVKGERGMVVWPPSWHKAGGRYTLDPSAPVEIAALPVDLVDVVTKPVRVTPAQPARLAVHALTTREPQRYAQETYERTIERIQRQQDGRNNALNDAAFALGQLVGLGLLDADEVARALIGAAMRPNLPYREARKTTFSGLHKGALLVNDSVAHAVERLREAQR